MARTVLVSQIVDQIQILVQDPDHALATEGQYRQFITDEYTRLYAAYIAAEPDRFRTEATITTVANTATYALPADWVGTIAVDYVSGSVRRPLVRLMENDRFNYVNGTGEAEAYRVIGSNVVIYPTPATVMTLTHVYIPAPPGLLALNDTIDCRLGHERFLQFCVARILLNSENTYDGRWDAEIAKTEAELKLEANYRYFQDQPTMRSERRLRRRGWPFNWPFGARW